MNYEQIEALADRIIALINSQLRSPTRAEIVNTILNVNCDPILKMDNGGGDGTHTLTTSQNGGMGITGGHYVPATGDIYSVLTMADVLKIARAEAEHATDMFAYADLRFEAKFDPMTDNILVSATRGNGPGAALGFSVTTKALKAPGPADMKSAIGVQCFRLGEMMLNAVPEGFHS